MSRNRRWKIYRGIMCAAVLAVLSAAGTLTVHAETYGGVTGDLWNQSHRDTLYYSENVTAGEYNIEITYLPTKESDADIVLGITVDRKAENTALESVKLPRSWVAEGENYMDEKGTEYASYLIQEERLLTERVYDRSGLSTDPVTLSLAAGEHEIGLKYISGSMIVKSVKLVPVNKHVSYAEYLKMHSGKEYDGEAILFEAENPTNQSARDIPSYHHNDTATSPYVAGQSRINAFGGNYWYELNSSASWDFTVPEDGFYKISMRVMQNNNGLVSYRQVMLDGEVPFEELLCYPFYSQTKFRTEALGGDEAYWFYLTKGSHTLTLRATAGDMSAQIEELRVLTQDISDTVSRIQRITGTSPDANFEYELEKKMPELLPTLTEYIERIGKISEQIEKVTGSEPAILTTLKSAASTFTDYVNHPDRIPMNVGQITTIQGDLNDVSSTLQSQPLGIDWISVMNPSEALYEPKTSKWEAFKLVVHDFVKSFSSDESANEDDKAINLWISRDREWGNYLQRMISEEFEPATGIKVNVNILPSGNTTVVNGASPLLLSVVAGTTPDIALGCDTKTPIELAIRGQAAAVSDYEDYEEIFGRFADTAKQILSYDGSCYAVPETMSVPVVVYRTDIFEQNGLEVPQTWEELWRYTLPQLAQIDKNFYMGSSSMSIYADFLYQNGGDFYDENGDCALNTEEAIRAFEQWTKCFVQYNVPQAASFYNEMRTGTIPIGICSLAEYMQILTYAGELTGKVALAPIPGTKGADGEIVRYGDGGMTCAMIFKDSEKKDECWTFLKWWTSADVQKRYAAGIEARVGATGRWFSSNLEAFYDLPWNQEDLSVIKDWMPWLRNTYTTLGSYYASRSISNAWTRTVMTGQNARDSIEQSREEIQIQIDRKKEEYGK